MRYNIIMHEEQCEHEKAHHIEYRLVNGTSFEGLSIREIYYDEYNKIIGWSKFPLSDLSDSRKDIIADIVEAVKGLDQMLDAAQKPILQEAELEAKVQ